MATVPTPLVMPKKAPRSSTHREYVGDGYFVTIQHCEHPGCNRYLGVNYPVDTCDDHRTETR